MKKMSILKMKKIMEKYEIKVLNAYKVVTFK